VEFITMRVIAALCFLAIATAANANECPVQGPQEKLKLVLQAPSCREAARLFKLCAIGSAFDGELALPVSENCERRVLAALKPNRRKAYEATVDACNSQYARMRGSMFRSHAAFCRVGAMEKFGRPR
jgi:hypothetical protein